MTESFDAATLREVVTFQLCLLELYESLLENCQWDESKVNATLKAFMASVLALLRVQQSLGEQVVVTQKDMIRQYRARLEGWLEEHAEATAEAGDQSDRGSRGRAS